MQKKLLDNFLKYVQIDTMSSEESETTPSTQKQFNLAKVLVEELKELGLRDIKLTPKCFVYATLPAYPAHKKGSIGFIAHMDTIPGFSGTNVKPNVIQNYDGKTIILNDLQLDDKQFSFLKNLKGKTLITTDGTTVLGADDKAGVAEIMTMLAVIKEQQLSHCEIHVAFTPDEEIGTGVEHFDLQQFPCDFAYTIDGGAYDEINYENFNAASAVVTIDGLDIHPGDAKNQMINASEIAMEFHHLLPENEKPQYTENYEGFIHLTGMKGVVGTAQLFYILRDHNQNKLNEKKEILKASSTFINQKYHKNLVHLKIQDSYSNMAELVMKKPEVIELAQKAMQSLGITPKSTPIRGGTDGARITFMGLPTPNLGTGGYNCHGPYELACLEEMEMVVKIILKIIELY